MNEILNMSSDDQAKANDFIKSLPKMAQGKLDWVKLKEQVWRKEHKLRDSDVIVYNIIRTNDNNAILMVTAVHFATKAFEVDGMLFPAETALIYREIEAIDLLQWLTEATEQGLKSVIEKFI